FGDFARLVHGIDPKWGPLAYTKTDEYPSHGIPNAADDITGGMGFEGLLNLQRFVERGGILVALGNSGVLPVQGGLVRRVRNVDGPNTPGSELRAKVLKPEHPIVYGYEERPSIFRGNGPLWDVDDRDRGWAVLQFGTKKVPEEEEKKEEPAEEEPAVPAEEPIEVEDVDEAPKPEEKKKTEAEDKRLVLSGFVQGEGQVDGKPAVLDVPVGKGRVVLYSFNPLHRYLNLSDFRLVYNVLLNWNDLP
ncbi:MAG: peptidase, partial [Thermoanaerobaculia bacterium]